jgi:hypothetical protein
MQSSNDISSFLEESTKQTFDASAINLLNKASTFQFRAALS